MGTPIYGKVSLISSTHFVVIHSFFSLSPFLSSFKWLLNSNYNSNQKYHRVSIVYWFVNLKLPKEEIAIKIIQYILPPTPNIEIVMLSFLPPPDIHHKPSNQPLPLLFAYTFCQFRLTYVGYFSQPIPVCLISSPVWSFEIHEICVSVCS